MESDICLFFGNKYFYVFAFELNKNGEVGKHMFCLEVIKQMNEEAQKKALEKIQ